MRPVPAILALYHAASLAARDGEFYVRCRERKSYLTREVVERWQIGCAPTLKQCVEAWEAAHPELSAQDCELALRMAGLLCDPLDDGPGRKPWMFFRDCMLFPYYEQAEPIAPAATETRARADAPIYFSSRRLKDLDAEGQPLAKDKKALCMRAPGENGRGGLPRPAGFNLQALDDPACMEVTVVEGCLDAIACELRGERAIAQIGAAMREDLGQRLRAWRKAKPGRVVYCMPDGTADMTPVRRADAAAAAGPLARICALPAGKDPDELTADEVAEVHANSSAAWAENVELMVGLVELSISGREQLAAQGLHVDEHKRIWARLCEWSREDRAIGERIWAKYLTYYQHSMNEADARKMREELGLPGDPDETPLPVTRPLGTGAGLVPNQIEPFKPKLDEEGGLPKLFNWRWEKRRVRNRKGELEERDVRIAMDLVEVRAALRAIFGGWPARIHAPGAKAPMLFMHHEGARSVQWIQSGLELEACLKRHCQLFFETGKDHDGKNYTSSANLYSDLGGSSDSHEFRAVEYYPHEPPLRGHYYLWRYPAEHKDDGSALFEFLRFFDNTTDDASLATVLAGVLTVFWGGDYSQRPIIVNEASHRGSGKSSVAKKTARLVGGYIAMTLGNSRDETEMMQRLLSPRGREKRFCLWDNVESNREVKSSWLDQNVTHDEISGKQMFFGEGTRPNNLCWCITVNNARLSPDIARRSFAARFEKPKYRPDWEPEINRIVDERGDEIASDCLAILKGPPPDVGWLVVEESFSSWAQQVYARAHAWLRERDLITDDLQTCLKQNAQWRHDRDDDVMEAAFILQELVARVARERGYISEDGTVNVFACKYGPKEDEPNDEFIPTLKREGDVHKSMCDHLEAILNRREVNAKWTGNVLAEHIKSGRMPGLEECRRRQRRGWLLRAAALKQYLDKIAQSEPNAELSPTPVA